jgi:hypothetical protein
MDDAHPLCRQMRLPEVGAQGQARIEAAQLAIGAGPGAAVELAYLCRAGVGGVTLASRLPCPSFAHAASFRHRAARDFAAGSWRALGELNAIIGAIPDAIPTTDKP